MRSQTPGTPSSTSEASWEAQAAARPPRGAATFTCEASPAAAGAEGEAVTAAAMGMAGAAGGRVRLKRLWQCGGRSRQRIDVTIDLVIDVPPHHTTTPPHYHTTTSPHHHTTTQHHHTTTPSHQHTNILPPHPPHRPFSVCSPAD